MYFYAEFYKNIFIKRYRIVYIYMFSVLYVSYFTKYLLSHPWYISFYELKEIIFFLRCVPYFTNYGAI